MLSLADSTLGRIILVQGVNHPDVRESHLGVGVYLPDAEVKHCNVPLADGTLYLYDRMGGSDCGSRQRPTPSGLG